MNLWNLYLWGVCLNWVISIQNDLQKWAVVACPGRTYPVNVMIKERN
jgi:hypothetical protein